MLGPNALTNELLDAYLRYLFSAHPIGVHNPELEESLRIRLSQDRPLVNGPILELDAASKNGATIAQLINEGVLGESLGQLRVAETDLAQRRLYTHQVDAIRASAAGHSVVVASGTGSGKTEAWLYPVVNEMLAHPGKGLRAIIVYPMNALADDQRRIRMRGLLSGTNVTYGEYTGNTPRDNKGAYANIDYNAPPNELQTRMQLRESPPNILITNPSMLEYLLLRPEDNALFAGANLQFIVLDEAHTYRGAYGIELGHLLRRLKSRLKTKSVRSFILSATIDHDLEAITRFAENLTGESFTESNIFFGEHEPPTAIAQTFHRPPEAYSSFTPDLLANIIEDPKSLGQVPGIEAFGEERVLRAMDAANGSRALWDILHDDGHVIALRDALQAGPQPIEQLARGVFGPHDAPIDDVIARLIDAASSARESNDSASLLPARYHVFLRGLDGLRVCFNPEHGAIGNGIHAIGKYYLETRETCECGYPLWELLVCGDCAAWYLRDLNDGAKSADAELSGPEGAIQLLDNDEDLPGDDPPRIMCLLCRAPGGCDCAESLKRSVVLALRRKTCLNCGDSKVMGVMTGTMAPTQILAEVLTSQQDADPKHVGRGTGKKLLTFSDSRRAAAQFAAQLDRAHRQHIVRAAIHHALLEINGSVGLDEMSIRVSKVLQKHGFLEPGPNGKFRATSFVFAEFTASYASRRRIESLGLGATKAYFESDPPNTLIELMGSHDDAISITQGLLEILQYDSAVVQPEFMSPLEGFAGQRPDVFYGLNAGDKRWVSADAPMHQRRRNRAYNLAARLVGPDKADALLAVVWKYAVADEVLVGGDSRYQISSNRLEFFLPACWYRCNSCRKLTPWGLSDGRGCATRNCLGALEIIKTIDSTHDHFARTLRIRLNISV